jgi:hypothetical protein
MGSGTIRWTTSSRQPNRNQKIRAATPSAQAAPFSGWPVVLDADRM